MSNEELVAEIQKGNIDLIPSLWDQTERYIWMQAGKRAERSGQRDMKEDLYHSGYFALLDAINGFKQIGEASFITYLSYHLVRCFSEAQGIKSSRQQQDPIHKAMSLDQVVALGETTYTISDILPDSLAALEFEKIVDKAEREAIQLLVHAGIESMPETHRQFFYRYLKCFNRSEVARQLGWKKGKAQQIHAKGYVLMRKYVKAHRDEACEIDLLDTRATRGTGLVAYKARDYTSSTESLALKLIEIKERHKRFRERLGLPPSEILDKNGQ